MKIEQYGAVELKTGEKAYIVEILEENKAYIADIIKGKETETKEIYIEDIKSVL